jgi:alpha-methylacyl-CoA racemase
MTVTSHSPRNESTPLLGLKVIELHAIGPVPFAGMLLQQLGASVTKIAPPHDPGLGIAIPAHLDALNVGKAIDSLDLKASAGQQALMQRLKSADVLLEGFRPGVLERLGLGIDVLSKQCPQLIVGRLSGWGNSGRLATRAGHDINYLALSGALHAIGHAQLPLPPLNLVADFGGGAMHLVVGVLAKLLQRSLDPGLRGGLVSTSILAGTHGLLPMFHGMVQAGMQNDQRAANLLDGGMPFYRCYRTADNRFVAVGALEPKFYSNLLSLLNIQNQLDVKAQYNQRDWPDALQVIGAAIEAQDRNFWATAAAHIDCCLTPVLTFSEARTDQHNIDNGWFTEHAPWPQNIINFKGLV